MRRGDADRSRVGQCARQQAGRNGGVIPQDLCRRIRCCEADRADDQRECNLRQAILLQRRDELRSYAVADGEQEYREEGAADDRRDLDVQLPDQQPRDERARDRADERAGFGAAEPETECEREEDRDLGIRAQGVDNRVDGGHGSFLAGWPARGSTLRERTPCASSISTSSMSAVAEGPEWNAA